MRNTESRIYFHLSPKAMQNSQKAGAFIAFCYGFRIFREPRFLQQLFSTDCWGHYNVRVRRMNRYCHVCLLPCFSKYRRTKCVSTMDSVRTTLREQAANSNNDTKARCDLDTWSTASQTRCTVQREPYESEAISNINCMISVFSRAQYKRGGALILAPFYAFTNSSPTSAIDVF